MKLNEMRKAYLDQKIDKPTYIKRMYEENHSSLFDFSSYIENTGIRKIEITDDGVLFTSRVDGIRMYSLEGDFRIAPVEILNFLEYEPDESSMMLRLIPKGAQIFDIGANAGWFSLFLAKRVEGGHVYAFEPIPKTFELLQRNIAENAGLAVNAFNFGFSDKKETLTFYYSSEGSGNASLVNVSENPNSEKVECQVNRLDEFASHKTVDFIKCDVEGAELLVFQGGLEVIRRNKPIIFSEMLRKWSAKYDYHPNDIIKLMADMGYGCYVVDDSRLILCEFVDENTIETNYFFLHKDKHSKEIELNMRSS